MPFHLRLLIALVCSASLGSAYFQKFQEPLNVLDSEAVDAKEFDDTKEFREYYKIFYVKNGYALIGARNYLYNVTVADMREVARYKINAVDFGFHRQRTDQAHGHGCSVLPKWISDMDVCHVYVTNVFYISDTLYEVYASYALGRLKLLLQRDPEQDQWVLNPTIEEKDLLMTVMLPFQNQSSLRTREGVNYNAGGIRVFDTLTRVKVARGPTAFDPQFKMTAETHFHVYGDSDAMFDVNFLGGFETDDHVYFAFTEIAHETFSQHMDSQKLTRLLRLCKNDRGDGMIMDEPEFALFNKVNLNCSRSIQGKSTTNNKIFRLENRVVLSVPFNVITGMSTLGHGSVKPRSSTSPTQEMFYGVFSAADGAQAASAVCAFTLKDIENAFNSYMYGELRVQVTDKYLTQLFKKPMEGNFFRPYYHFKKETFPDLSTCRNDTAKLPNFYKNYNKGVALHVDPVESATKDPLFFQTNDDQLHHLVVEWQVEAVDGTRYDILYAGSDSGNLYKLMNTGSTEEWSMVESRPVFPGAPFAQLRLEQGEGGEPSYILASSYDKVVNIPVSTCGTYQTCSACVGAQDPHCSWFAGDCATDVRKGFQNISSGYHSACPIPEDASLSSSEISAPTAVHISVGVFVAGVLGAVVVGALFGIGGTYFFMWSQSKSRSFTRNLDRNLVNRHQKNFGGPLAGGSRLASTSTDGKLSSPFLQGTSYSTYESRPYTQSTGLYNAEELDRYRQRMFSEGQSVAGDDDDEQGSGNTYESVATPSPTEKDNNHPPTFDSLLRHTDA